MSNRTRKLLEAALALSPDERAALAFSLIDSLDEQSDPDAAACWEAEVARRLAELEAGAVTPLDRVEAFRRIFGGPDASPAD